MTCTVLPDGRFYRSGCTHCGDCLWCGLHDSGYVHDCSHLMLRSTPAISLAMMCSACLSLLQVLKPLTHTLDCDCSGWFSVCTSTACFAHGLGCCHSDIESACAILRRAISFVSELRSWPCRLHGHSVVPVSAKCHGVNVAVGSVHGCNAWMQTVRNLHVRGQRHPVCRWTHAEPPLPAKIHNHDGPWTSARYRCTRNGSHPGNLGATDKPWYLLTVQRFIVGHNASVLVPFLLVLPG
jgi:hypothetical protein